VVSLSLSLSLGWWSGGSLRLTFYVVGLSLSLSISLSLSSLLSLRRGLSLVVTLRLGRLSLSVSFSLRSRWLGSDPLSLSLSLSPLSLSPSLLAFLSLTTYGAPVLKEHAVPWWGLCDLNGFGRMGYVWAALAKPLVNVDFGRDRYTADVDEMQVCSSDLGLSCDICGNTAHELYTFRCYKKRPPGADVTGEDHRRLHRCKAFLGKDCGKGLLGKRSEHSKALEGLEKVLMQPDADEQLQVLYASSSRKIQRLIEEQLSFYSHRGAGGDMRPRSWTPSDDKDMSSRRSMSAAVGGAGARRICKFYGVREYQGHPACGVDFLSGRLRDYGWESNKSLLSHGLSERDKRGPRLRHSVPCDPYDPYRVIHTVQDKLVLKLAAARTLRNHHTVAGWSLPLSVYPPSLSLSLSLSLSRSL